MPSTHSTEFRQRAVDLARRSGQSIPQLALDLGVSPSTIRKWLEHDGRNPVEGCGPPDKLRKELDDLRRQVSSLTVEVELLKRVALHYAEPSRPTRPRSRTF